MIRVLVNGAAGRMGSKSCQAIEQDDELDLVATAGRGDDLARLIAAHQVNVVLDLTLPECVFHNSQIILQSPAAMVIGTTGLTPRQIGQLEQQCQQLKRGAILAPNFSIAASLMIKFAQQAAKFFPKVEIIESHHDRKVDSPSGTARRTADLLTEQAPTIHSIRLPGIFAEQDILFGGEGETLSIKHRAIDRACMMPGVVLCCKKVTTLDHFVYGFENIL